MGTEPTITALTNYFIYGHFYSVSLLKINKVIILFTKTKNDEKIPYKVK